MTPLQMKPVSKAQWKSLDALVGTVVSASAISLLHARGFIVQLEAGSGKIVKITHFKYTRGLIEEPKYMPAVRYTTLWDESQVVQQRKKGFIAWLLGK